MKPLFPIVLIIVSLLSLTLPFLFLFINIRKMEAPFQLMVKNILYSKKIEFIIGILAYLFILIGAVGLLKEIQWSKSLVLTGLVTLLVYVWVQNVWKIFYFRKLKSRNAAPLRGEMESKMENIFEPLEVDIMNEITLDDDFYKLAARKNISKSIGRIVVGSALLIPAIFYLVN